jgi:hypothetical protein
MEDRYRNGWRGFYGAGTFVAVVFAFAAFHDITSDWTARNFAPEYAFLIVCAVWFGAVSMRLLKTHRSAGLISLAALLFGAVGQRGVHLGTVPSWTFDYVATTGALLWFLMLSVWLLAAGVWYAFRPARRPMLQ